MNCIVNVSNNWGIGRGGDQLVYLSADLKRFRALTTGKTVILGRRTLATFPGGRPLKNRTNLILSATPGYAVEGATVCPTLEALLAEARSYADDDLCVIGGASLYRQLLPYCHRAQITRTQIEPEADTFFPDLDAMPNWQRQWESAPLEENGVRFQYIDYVNLTPKTY